MTENNHGAIALHPLLSILVVLRLLPQNIYYSNRGNHNLFPENFHRNQTIDRPDFLQCVNCTLMLASNPSAWCDVAGTH
jgi:hypothetical protein